MSIINTALIQKLKKIIERTELITTERLLINNDSVTLPYKAKGTTVLATAYVFDDNVSYVFEEYTCAVATDKVTLEFDPLDNLDGKYAVVTFLGVKW